jgi:hypothetical protein
MSAPASFLGKEGLNHTMVLIGFLGRTNCLPTWAVSNATLPQY